MDGWREKEDKYIFPLCLHGGRRFSFNVSGEERERCFLSRGDCHQSTSWHLNHPLQIRVFEMQIQLHLPRQIKRHTQEWGKKTTYILTVFHPLRRRRQTLPSLSLASADYASHSGATEALFVCSLVHRSNRGSSLLSRPRLLRLQLSTSIRYFFFPTEKI